MWNDWRRREKTDGMKSQYHENMNQLWRSDHIERWLQLAARSNTHTHTYEFIEIFYKLKCEFFFCKWKMRLAAIIIDLKMFQLGLHF